ncbi:aldo/keto reductase [Flavobacterium sp. F52]|nr:aldo/keto reductase [Flavobacterium sp. F52]
MVNLKNLSKIGIGTYRMSIQDLEHRNSLNYAIEKGINLIDTASNYQNGDSEKLIGNFIKDSERKNVFVVTKAGYIQGDDIEKIKGLNIKKLIKITNHFFYSLDKKFIKFKFYESLKNLNTDYIDCFLIHNPEHYFAIENNYQKDIINDILEIFEFLESLVTEGKLRYYGISSNNIATINSKGIDIHKILELKSNYPSFKILQFPYNIVEREASNILINKNSLISLSKEKNIITMSNRPLNSSLDGKVLRLVYNKSDLSLIEHEKEEDLFNSFLIKITEKLKILGENSPLDVFLPIKFFIDNRKIIANSEAIDKAINNYLIPFLSQIELNNYETINMLRELRNYWVLFSKEFNNKRLESLQQELVHKGILDSNDKREFPVLACNFYLKNGIDHVLMGLRNKKYIDEITEILQ